MPTYTVTCVEGTLDAPKRAKIASEITRIHSETTGAPAYFAQVIFTEVAPDRYFIGGGPLKGHQVFVNGQIRGGRLHRHAARPQFREGTGARRAISMTLFDRPFQLQEIFRLRAKKDFAGKIKASIGQQRAASHA